MRVGLVVYGPLNGRSGGFLYDRRLADALEARGETVDVVSLPERPYLRSTASNLAPGLVDRLSDCDIVLEDALCHPSLPLVNRRLTGTPVVALVHYLTTEDPDAAPPTELTRPLERAFLRSVDARIYNSRDTRRAVRELLGEGSPTEVPELVAPPAGDRFGAPVDAATVRERARSGPLRVVGVGSVVPRKGFETLLEGLSRVEAPWALTIVGDDGAAPGYAGRLRGLAADRGAADRVTLTGRVDDDRLAATLRDSHVLAVPSRYEPFGIVYLEGMAFGLPALASTHGGASEVVTDGETGALVPPSDPAAVADGLAPLCHDRDRLARMGERALDRFASHPDWAATAGSIREFLRSHAG